jgi:Cft2 family RNA processing exonuclease
MQKLYDQHLAHWKESAVAYNNYQKFGTLFDRNLKWDEKVRRVKNLSSK